MDLSYIASVELLTVRYNVTCLNGINWANPDAWRAKMCANDELHYPTEPSYT